MVQSEHRGPIPGIPVGSRWGLRVYAAESGVHRPLVAGIAGGSKHGAVSIVLAGGYPEDVDNGMEFLYTGSGGRELSEGNKRVAEQTSDQQLTNFNKALAMTCHCAFNKHGGTAKDWRQSSPIRVCRSAKLKNKYSPDEGVRYDGIYKIVKYWQEKGKDSVHKVWRFKFRRDDTEPAPWTAAGKARTERLGLVLDDRRFPSIRRTVLELHPELLKFMSKDVVNQDRWKRIQGREFTNFPEMMDVIFRDVFSCEICTNIFDQPVSTPCGHTFCGICFVKSCECMNSIECPSCRLKFEEGATAPNIALQVIFGALKKPKEEYMSVKRLPGFNDENKDKKATSKNDSPATATSNSSSKVRVTLSRGKTKSAAASLSDAMVPSTNSTAAFTSLSRETATLLTPRATPTRATSMSPDLFTVKKETVENALTFIRATRSNKNPELLALNDDPEVIFRQRHSRTSHSNQRPELTPVKEEIIESTSFSSRTTRPTRSRKDSELIARSDDPEEFFRRRHSRISLSCEQPSTVTKLVRVKDEPEEDLLPSRRHTNLYQDQEIRGHDTAGSRLKRTAPVESRETEEEEGSSLRLFSKRSRVVHVNLPLA
ncbi:hypothetical protein BGZ83_011572 [Gryganskiella cystojenkinii]|nr:hypothetical protein BGZ83_011572 [Gryganskiella cystojenkinii]